VVAAGYAAGLVFGIADVVRDSRGVVAFDERVFGWCSPWRTDARVALAMFVTGFGNTSTVVAVMLVVTGVLWAHARRGLIGPMWVQFVGCELVTTLAKYGIDRARPVFTTIATATTPSFPSGHTTGSAAVYGFVAYAIARDLPSSSRRFAIGYWAVVLIILVGVSRVFLGVHFFSDVVAGYLIGAFWLLVGFAIAEHVRGPQ
jgi:undecaprenyl-diphosphatase